METVINGLLKQFENGKMTRRQLIQSLALAARGGAGRLSSRAQAASTIPAATAAAAFKTVWLDHISYAVTDYRKSTAFYRDLMGWEIRNDNGKNQCTMKIGDIGEIIIRNRREPTRRRRASRRAAPITGVINHVSYGIANWNTDGGEGRAGKARPEAAAGHGRRQLQELPRQGSRRLGSADQQRHEGDTL